MNKWSDVVRIINLEAVHGIKGKRLEAGGKAMKVTLRVCQHDCCDGCKKIQRICYFTC